MAVSVGSATRELWYACCVSQEECCYRCCVSRERGCVVSGYAMAAAPASRREYMCLQFLRLLKPSCSLLAHVLPTLGSANSADSVNSKTSGITNRMKNSTQYNSIFLSILCDVAIILIYVYYKPQFIMLLFSLLMGICLLSNLRGNVVF